ncbi:wax ester/triacylglycerol synthase domain-containing protein [Rhodococcus zopfii]|uniref:wax ester/triacylglycerol synthase domain-containing protein n=3 Tax=Rhodococcus zopfii TaxID=43772 RepID=UPI000934A848
MQMHPTDARRDWLGDRLPSDQFLVYCFDAPSVQLERVLAELAARAALIGDLRTRAVDVPGLLDYPYWTDRDIGDDQFTTHPGGDWEAATTLLGRLVEGSLDIRVSSWRLHLIPDVTGAPGGDGPALIAVLQISHAVADGVRASALARALFEKDSPPRTEPPRAPAPAAMLVRAAVKLPGQIVGVVADGVRANRAERELAGPSVPPPAPGCPLVAVNTAPGPRRTVRTLVCDAADLRRAGTVTVAALTAIGPALARFLEVGDALGAEVPVAVPAATGRNAYRSVGVALRPDLRDTAERAAAIAAELDLRRRRVTHPAMAVRSRTEDHVPAPLLRFGTDRTDLSVVPPTVTGNTVVSSVNRGSADLVLGGAAVRFTAGYPSLSPVMALTHGVHGLGDTVAVSVTTSPDVLDDAALDRYVELLRASLGGL